MLMQGFLITLMPGVSSNLVRVKKRWLHPLIRFVLIGILTFGIAVGAESITLAQLPLPSPAAPTLASPPAGVERRGALEITNVMFDGEELFRIASPTVRDRTNPGELIPVEERAEQIQANLNRVIQDDIRLSPSGIVTETNYDLDTLQVYTSTLNNDQVIFVKDKNHPEPLSIITVTQSDAVLYGQPVEEVAALMQQRISTRLREALTERTQETLEAQIGRAFPIFGGMLVASLGLFLLQKRLKARDSALQEQKEVEVAEPPLADETSPGAPIPATHRLGFQAALKQQFTFERRRRLVAFFRWLAFWGQIAVWVGGIGIILSLFPWTRPLSEQILSIPLSLLMVWFVTGLLIRAGDMALDSLAKAWEEGNLFARSDDHREALRISTAIGALKGLKTFAVYIVGITWLLSVIGLPVGSVLAIGGIVAFAISLGFQNVVRDVVNGFLILMEDQYAVGDVVSIGNDAGLVENMNLRITQLRDAEGRLITIPNSAITHVRNLTRTWSRVDFSIEIAYSTDIDFALGILRDLAQQMYDEPEWRDRIIGPPEVLGVDSLSHTGMLLRVWIRTKPAQQWVVGREFRRRVRVAFDQYGIAIGKPQQDAWLMGEGLAANGSSSGQVQAEEGSKSDAGSSQSPER
jgi:small conductance mechanosensitive channel